MDAHIAKRVARFTIFLEFNSVLPSNFYNKDHNKAQLYSFQVAFNDEQRNSIKRIQFATKQFHL